jgi:hypothetical protein
MLPPLLLFSAAECLFPDGVSVSATKGEEDDIAGVSCTVLLLGGSANRCGGVGISRAGTSCCTVVAVVVAVAVLVLVLVAVAGLDGNANYALAFSIF